MGVTAPPEDSFKRRTVLLITAVGVLAFLVMLVLGAYAPDLRSGDDGGSHALSNSATGFRAIVELAELTGRNPQVLRSGDLLRDYSLLVVTPGSGTDDLGPILERRGPYATLVVLPKWAAVDDPEEPSWVRIQGLTPDFQPEGVLAPAHELQVTRVRTASEPLVAPGYAPKAMQFNAPELLQTVSGEGLTPVLTDQAGRIVLAEIDGTPLYVLADPDLLNNHGMRSATQARAALAMLDFLNETGAEAILFDVTINGLGASRSPLKLALSPPFVAVTAAIALAMALAGIQALHRFGAPRPPRRALPYGKAALLDNTAALVKRAGREGHLGSHFAAAVRGQAATLLRLPSGLTPAEVAARLDRLPTTRRFTELAKQASAARQREEMVQASRALHRWLEEIRP